MPDTPETKVKKYLAKECKRMFETLGVPYALIANAAGVMSQQGRADYDLIVNNFFYFHIEVKGPGRDKRDPAQCVFEAEARNGAMQFLINSNDGVDQFLRDMPQHINHIMLTSAKAALGFGVSWNDNIDTYSQAKERNSDAAAKRPKRQSSKLH